MVNENAEVWENRLPINDVAKENQDIRTFVLHAGCGHAAKNKAMRLAAKKNIMLIRTTGAMTYSMLDFVIRN